MLSFEITAIDLILVIAVIALLLLYVAKLVNSPEEFLKKPLENKVKHETVELNHDSGYGECPRGFGKIKGIGNDNSISDRCLGCYRLSMCYLDEEKSSLTLSA
jgi:hypothetical protein